VSLSVGARLGPYEVVAAIGAGGMGEVYRAHDRKLNRDVAIKVLPDAVAQDAERLARFTREAQTLAALNHPNIAQIYGFEGDGSPAGNGETRPLVRLPLALVMEFVEGDDLSTMTSHGPLPLSDALPIARQIADALEAAHELGIVHRDLKPANIKVRADGTVKVLDFGLAKALVPDAASASAGAMNSPTLTAHATQMGIILGTAAYMAPEQARGKPVDKRADVWAFGVVLYEMLTGRRVFAGDEISDVLAAVLRQDIDWTVLPANTPLRLRRLLERCLDRDVKQRLRDIGEARVEIAKIESGAPDLVSGVIPAVAIRDPTWRRALPWAVAGLATLIAILVSVAYLNQEAETGPILRFTVSTPFGVTRPWKDGFEVSPDGQALAFSAISADGRSRIFVRGRDQPEAQPLAGTENGVLPFWSPDSQFLGFTKEGALYRTDLAGTAPRRLCEIPGRVEDTKFVSSRGTWGGRGVIVFASSEGRLFQVPDGGGAPTPVTALEPAHNEATHRSPSFLPDGRRVLFLALSTGATRGVIWAVALDNPTRTRVTESSGGAAYAAGQLLTTTEPPRRLVAQPFDPERLTLSGAPRQVQDHLGFAGTFGEPGFSASLNDLVVEPATQQVHQLVWVDRAGRVQETIGPVARIADFALAPDERRVVATIRDASSRKNDLWLFDGQRTEGTRLTFQPDPRRPLWARDGGQVYFTTMPGFETWSLRLSAAAQPEPFENPGKFWHFEDMNRTSEYLLFKANEPATIWMQRIGAPSQRQELVRAAVGASGPRVSPDSRWLAYALDLPAGPEVFVQPFDRPGRPQQISTSGGIGPVWRADSRELYFEARGRLMAVATSEAGNSRDIGTPQKLFDIHTQWYVGNQPHNVEVAANGQKFLVNTIVGNTDNAPLEVTVNWIKALKK
jgi:serine/threonine protein kinase/Tol biopolymer transport system component